MEVDSSNSENAISAKECQSQNVKPLSSTPISAEKRHQLNSPARIMNEHTTHAKQKNAHACEKHVSGRSKHWKSRRLKLGGNNCGEHSRSRGKHFEIVDVEEDRFGYDHFRCPNCGVCCVLKNKTCASDWVLKQSMHCERSVSGAVPVPRNLRSRRVLKSAVEKQDDGNRLSSSEGYPRCDLLEQRPRVSPGTDSEKYAKAITSGEKFRDYLSDSVLPRVQIQVKTLPRKQSPQEPCVCQTKTVLKGLDDECSRSWPLASKVHSSPGGKPQAVLNRDGLLEARTKMPYLLASSTDSSSSISFFLDKSQIKLLKKRSKYEHSVLGFKRSRLRDDMESKKVQSQYSRRGELVHDLLCEIQCTPWRRQFVDANLSTMTESSFEILHQSCHVKQTKMPTKTESLGERCCLHGDRVCHSEPLASSSRLSLDRIFSDSRRTQSWSEPCDLDNDKLLNRRQGRSRVRSQLDSHVCNTEHGCLELFNVSQWQVDQQDERGDVIYDEIYNGQNESKNSLQEQTSADDMTVVALAVQHPSSRLIKDRKWLKSVIPNAIVGEELIRWLLKNVGGIVSRHDAVAYAQQMLKRGLITSPLSSVTKLKPQWYYTVSPTT